MQTKNTKTKTISVILQPEMLDEIERIMEEEDRSMSWIIRKAIQEYIDKNKGE